MGMPRQINYGLADLRGDVFGGLTASGIALPVAMGYGVISGLGAAAGLYGAIAVGIFASIFGGTRGRVYGPNIVFTIPMAVIVTEYSDSLAEAATVGILAGLIQIVFGVLGLGRYASYIPFSLSSGYFTAFGILLMVKQSLLALGASPMRGGVVDTIQAWPDAIADLNIHALALTVICLALGLLWRGRLRRLCPAPFVALAAGILIGALWLKNAPTVGEIPMGLPTVELSAVSLDFFLRVLQPAFVMALLGSASTLITALRLDAITGSQNRPNREMIAQGHWQHRRRFNRWTARFRGLGQFRQRLQRRTVADRRPDRCWDVPGGSPCVGTYSGTTSLCGFGSDPDCKCLGHY